MYTYIPLPMLSRDRGRIIRKLVNLEILIKERSTVKRFVIIGSVETVMRIRIVIEDGIRIVIGARKIVLVSRRNVTVLRVKPRDDLDWLELRKSDVSIGTERFIRQPAYLGHEFHRRRHRISRAV